MSGSAFAIGRPAPLDRPVVCAAVASWPSGRTRVTLGGFGQGAYPGNGWPGARWGGPMAAREAYRFAGDEWASAAYRMDVAGKLVQRLMADDSQLYGVRCGRSAQNEVVKRMRISLQVNGVKKTGKRCPATPCCRCCGGKDFLGSSLAAASRENAAPARSCWMASRSIPARSWPPRPMVTD